MGLNLRWLPPPGSSSRDTRDTLFMLAVIAWTVAPHLSHLPIWCAVLTSLILIWRARLALVSGPLPGRVIILGVLGLSIALSLWSFGTLIGRQAGVTMLVALVSLKTLELRARRDAFVVFFLGFFLVLTHFLFSQSIAVALAMVVSVWGLLTSLVLTHMPVGQPALRQAAQLAARTALLGAPIMMVLFVLFPRVGPLWGVPQDKVFNTGLGDSIHMGSVAELAQSNEIVMRVRFFDPPPNRASMYFRGPVLSEFDGREWRAMTHPGFAPEHTPGNHLRLEGPSIRYELTLEPQQLREIPLLEATETPPQREGVGAIQLDMRLTDDLRWVARSAVVERLRLRAEAHIEFQHGPTVPMLGLQDYVALPPGANPRTLAWAAALRRQPKLAHADSQTLAQTVLDHIQTENFHYTLTPGLYGTQNMNTAIDEFWLDRRTGFCEHFATAFVVVMRALDIPARVVTGYQGVDPVPVDGYYVVRQNSAHAWAEYWQAGRGWVRADPTASVAPERISRSANLPAPPSLVVGTLQEALGSSAELLTRWRNSWEAINNRWNQWVLNYSSSQQFDLLKQVGFRTPRLEDLAWTLVGLCSTAMAIGLLFAGWRHHHNDAWTTRMATLRHTLRSLGIPTADHDPPLALARHTRQTLPGQGETLAQALSTLDQLRYGQTTSPSQLARQFRAIRRHAKALQIEQQKR